MDTVLVGIGSKARQGKGTVAKTIIDKWKVTYDIREYSFAEELKREVNSFNQFEYCFRHAILYDTNPDMSDPLCHTQHGKQSRLLQYYGQAKRKQDSFYWIKKLDKRLKADKPDIAVISDLRYLNEFYYVRSNGGFTIKCTRNGFVDLSRDNNHVSEVDLDGVKFDYELTAGEGELEELKSDALTVFDMILAELSPAAPNIAEIENAA